MGGLVCRDRLGARPRRIVAAAMCAATPLANTPNATPTSAHLAGAFVVHGIVCSGPWTQKIQEAERAFGRWEGGVIVVRWLL